MQVQTALTVYARTVSTTLSHSQEQTATVDTMYVYTVHTYVHTYVHMYVRTYICITASLNARQFFYSLIALTQVKPITNRSSYALPIVEVR